MHFKKIFFPTIVFLLSLILTLLVIESIFRYRAYRDDKKNIQAWQNIGHGSDRPTSQGYKFQDIIRMSRHPGIIYELIPHLSGSFIGKPLTTNQESFRGLLHATAKGQNTLRIIGLGDSVMFGWGVGDNEYYLSRLSEYLNEAYPEFSWEVINTAVPGYNTVMEVETLKEKGLNYEPDLIILDYVWNDLSLPNFIIKKANYFTLRKSYLAEFILLRLKGKDLQERSPFIIAPVNPDDVIENDPDRVPDEYRHLVGEEAFHKAFQELRGLSDENNFLVLVVSQGKLPEFVKQACSRAGIPWVEAGHAMREYMVTHSISDQRKSNLVVSEGGYHPSALGHEIIAKVVFNYLRKSGLIQKIMHQP